MRHHPFFCLLDNSYSLAIRGFRFGSSKKNQEDFSFNSKGDSISKCQPMVAGDRGEFCCVAFPLKIFPLGFLHLLLVPLPSRLLGNTSQKKMFSFGHCPNEGGEEALARIVFTLFHQLYFWSISSQMHVFELRTAF